MPKEDTTNATRQARYRDRKKANGFIRYTVWIRPEDMIEGQNHGKSGRKTFPIPPDKDAVSWILGSHMGQEQRAQETAARKALENAPAPAQPAPLAFTPNRALNPDARKIPTTPRKPR